MNINPQRPNTYTTRRFQISFFNRWMVRINKFQVRDSVCVYFCVFHGRLQVAKFQNFPFDNLYTLFEAGEDFLREFAAYEWVILGQNRKYNARAPTHCSTRSSLCSIHFPFFSCAAILSSFCGACYIHIIVWWRGCITSHWLEVLSLIDDRFAQQGWMSFVAISYYLTVPIINFAKACVYAVRRTDLR